MARVLVVSDDGRTTIEITTTDEGWTHGECSWHCDAITDRGQFEDTVQAAEIHADQQH